MTFNKSLVPSVALISGGMSFQVIRQKGYEFEKGRPVSTGEESFTIKGNLQPLTGNEILRLDEGDRTRDQFNLWTKGKLKKTDEVLVDGRKYQVEQVEDWQSHQKVRIVRMDVESVS